MTAEHRKQRLRRLDLVFVRSPIYFVTASTQDRQKLLATAAVHETFLRFGQEGPRAWGMDRRVRDHARSFASVCRNGYRKNHTTGLDEVLKNAISKALRLTGVAQPHWQKTFFDHLLRSVESYSEKWNYVRENPVRAGLVRKAAEWPFLGGNLFAGVSFGVMVRRS